MKILLTAAGLLFALLLAGGDVRPLLVPADGETARLTAILMK